MPDSPRRDEEQIPELVPDRPDVAHDDGPRVEKDDRPADDHSEREWGGDQDIDTAGEVPDA